jgi:hypothetical protein
MQSVTEGRPILENPGAHGRVWGNATRGAVDVKGRLLTRAQARLRAPALARREDGFSLMEAILAMSLFAIIATALLGVLVTGVSAQRLSRQKTMAEQGATAQVEYIRTLPYDDVGNPGGNPDGLVVLSQALSSVIGNNPGLSGWTITSKVEWNNNPSDKVATAYRNAAFYKKVTITVTRGDGKVLASMVTYVSDTGLATGVSDAEIDLTVNDIGNNTPVQNQDVLLKNGPSSVAATGGMLKDTTDPSGEIIFPALIANPTSGPTAFYDLAMTPPSGYTLLKDDDITQTPNSANAHVQLAPSQVFTTTLRVYKGSTINVVLQNASTGLNYNGAAQVTLATTLRGSAASQTFTYPGAFPINAFLGEPVIPSPSPVISGGYTATVTNGFYATGVTKATVPNNYPSDLTSTFTLSGYPTGTLTATVTWAGNPVSGATVTLNGGPASITKTASTNAGGVATFTDVPEGSGYTLSATKSGQTSASTPATAVAGTTTNVAVAMPVGTIAVTVTSGGSPVSGATVTVTGGNITGTITGGSTTDVNGQVTIPNVPAGSGMTVTATKGAQTGSTNSVSVTGGSTTNVTVAMPLGTVAVTVLWAGNPVANCVNCVTLSGGALGSPVTGSTNGSGQVTFNNIPAASGYTVSATKGGQTGSTSGVTVTGGSTTNVTVNMPVGTVNVHVDWAGSPASGVTVQLSLGNITGTITAGSTTDASGNVTVANVPAGSGVTVTGQKSGQTGTTSGVTVASPGPTNVTVNMPVGTFTVTVNQPAGTPAQGANVTLSGGPMGISVSGSTNASGQVVFSNAPTGGGYTVSASRYGINGSAASQTVTGSTTINLANYATGSIKIVVKRSGGSTCNTTNLNWTITGAPFSTSGNNTTNASGVLVTAPGIPAFAGSSYTVTATKTGAPAGTGSTTVSVVSSGSTVTATVTLNTNTCP